MSELPAGPPDFEAEGLLDGLDGADERAARLDLLAQLTAAGVGFQALRRAVDQDRLAALPVELVFTRDCRFTLNDAIRDSGLDPEFVRRDFLALGLPMPAPDEPAFSEADLESFRMVKQALDLGLPEESMLELARISGRSAAQASEAMIELFARAFLRPGDTERDFGLRFAAVADGLTPALGPLTETPVRMHLRDRVRREVVTRTARTSGELPGTREVGVCFTDLVDFTGLTERLPVQDVAAVTGRFETLAAEVAAPPVRLVKLIGDAAMLVSPDLGAVVHAARELVGAVDRDPALPSARAGVAVGEALNRGGDWYGPPVNLASRITGVAEPGTVVVSDPVSRALRAGFDWRPIGARRLRGIEADVILHQLGSES